MRSREPSSTKSSADEYEEADLRPLSFTQLNTYAICPRRYYYSYVRGIKVIPPLAVVQGKVVHEVLEAAHKSLRDVRAMRPREAVELHEERWTTVEVEASGDEVAAARRVGRDLVRIYIEGAYNARYPVDVERYWDGYLDDIPLSGIVDLTERPPEAKETSVLDIKVRSRAGTGTDIVRSPQLGLYSWILRSRHVGFIELVRPKYVNVLTRHLTDADIENSLEWVRDTARAIVNSRATDSWPRCWRDNVLCSPKYCGYYGLCYR